MHIKAITISFLTLFLCFSLALATMVCPTCGKTYPDDYVYCEEEGTKLVKVKPKPKPEGPQTKVVGPGIKLVRIPGGTFQMGSNDGEADEKPAHQVTVDGFWLGETEVTIGQYVAFLNLTQPTTNQLGQWTWFDESTRMLNKYTHITISGNKFYADTEWEKHPVTYITWFGARDFCAQYGLRLPTEAEWEYAAGGPKHYIFPWGNEFDKSKCCNNNNKGVGDVPTMNVKRFSRNGYCLYDMAGNVYEWCSDLYDVYPGGKPGENDKVLIEKKWRIMRGGSFHEFLEFRCSIRYTNPAIVPGFGCGFRVAGD